jgi:hypothetical protein
MTHSKVHKYAISRLLAGMNITGEVSREANSGWLFEHEPLTPAIPCDDSLGIIKHDI